MDVLIWLKNHLSLSYSFKSLVKKKMRQLFVYNVYVCLGISDK